MNTQARTRQGTRSPIMIMYLRFRARACSAYEGAAPVISTGVSSRSEPFTTPPPPVDARRPQGRANISVVFSDKFCDQLRDAFREARYEPDAVVDLLGGPAHAALGRGEPEPARRAGADGGPLGTLIRMFLLGDSASRSETQAAFGSLSVADAVAEGLLREDGGNLRADLDVRPYGDDQGSWWVVSDQDSDLRGAPVRPDHVLGVGHASLSLARATARRPV